jgi:hypothetical protein
MNTMTFPHQYGQVSFEPLEDEQNRNADKD